MLDPGSECSIDERYAAMPMLTKADIRHHGYAGFVPSGRDCRNGIKKNHIELVKTSGTTDEQVTLIWNQDWWDASERASWNLHSYVRRISTGRQREALLASPISVGVISWSGRMLSMKKRRLWHYLFLNEFIDAADWTDALFDRMIHELALFCPVVLEANPALLARLAWYINRNGRKVFNPKLIVLTYEFPSRVHLRQIRKAFSSPIASSYGSTESGYVFMQCEKGNFHQNVDFCRVDIQQFRNEYTGKRNVGRLLVTTFRNKWFSIVRFNVGDVARILKPGSCPCGRSSGYTAVIEGRVCDITFKLNGQAVTVDQLDKVVNKLTWVLEYQLEQNSASTYLLRVVSCMSSCVGLAEEAIRVLKRLYGRGAGIKVKFERIIIPEVSGKHRLAKTSFPVDSDSMFE